MILTNPAAAALTELSRVPWVRFAVLALSSIFFLVVPFAAIGFVSGHHFGSRLGAAQARCAQGGR